MKQFAIFNITKMEIGLNNKLIKLRNKIHDEGPIYLSMNKLIMKKRIHLLLYLI